MTIRTDSGNLLLYIYKCKIDGNEISTTDQLLIETGWDDVRLNNAIQYLVESKFVSGKVLKTIGSTKVQVAFITDIIPLGINIIEDESKFKQNFGFTVNLGILQFHWGTQES